MSGTERGEEALGKRRKFLCHCGRWVSVQSNKPRSDGRLCLRYHRAPDGFWCTHNRLVTP